MNFSRSIRQMTVAKDGAADLDCGDVHDLFAAMLDDGLADLDLGAMLVKHYTSEIER